MRSWGLVTTGRSVQRCTWPQFQERYVALMLKVHLAETYVEESAAASASLARLSKSLNILRALDLYRDA